MGGIRWPDLLNILRPGGRYITSGAIAGPIVELDLRILYLKDLTLKGSTWQDVKAFKNLISLIEKNRIKPIIAKTFELRDIIKAQEMFLKKDFIGKIVLTIPKIISLKLYFKLFFIIFCFKLLNWNKNLYNNSSQILTKG